MYVKSQLCYRLERYLNLHIHNRNLREEFLKHGQKIENRPNLITNAQFVLWTGVIYQHNGENLFYQPVLGKKELYRLTTETVQSKGRNLCARVRVAITMWKLGCGNV